MHKLIIIKFVFLILSGNCFGMSKSQDVINRELDNYHDLNELYQFALSQLGNHNIASSKYINGIYQQKEVKKISESLLVVEAVDFYPSFNDQTIGRFKPSPLEMVVYGAIAGLGAWTLSAVLEGSTTDDLPFFLLVGAGMGALAYIIGDY